MEIAVSLRGSRDGRKYTEEKIHTCIHGRDRFIEIVRICFAVINAACPCTVRILSTTEAWTAENGKEITLFPYRFLDRFEYCAEHSFRIMALCRA